MTEKFAADILSANKLSSDVYELVLDAKNICDLAECGQFVMLYLRDGAHLLPRPISICDTEGGLRLVFRVVGFGTEYFSTLKKGDTIDILGPLGNSFIIETTTALIFGGGVGIPPMLGLSKKLYSLSGKKPTVVLGYRNSETFLAQDFKDFAEVIIATDDGSAGEKGNVIDVAERLSLRADNIYACGPLPMLHGVKNYAEKISSVAQLSLEERMACGFGVCLGCVVKTTEVDDHSKVKNKRVCKDGPVFYANEVDI